MTKQFTLHNPQLVSLLNDTSDTQMVRILAGLHLTESTKTNTFIRLATMTMWDMAKLVMNDIASR